ncbi:unnamed protein product, partial [Sphenostylis stenocarpa]
MVTVKNAYDVRIVLPPAPTGSLSLDQYTAIVVGAKSCNIQLLSSRVPTWIKIPMSVALTFGAFETALLDKVNKTCELEHKIRSSKLPWPVDEGNERWSYAWQAIKKVWASKWNERAFLSCQKAKLNHENICMAVLIQEVICGDYAFVIHTKNPLSGDATEIYAE